MPYSVGVGIWQQGRQPYSVLPVEDAQYANIFPAVGSYTCLTYYIDLQHVCNPQTSSFSFSPLAGHNQGCSCHSYGNPDCPPYELNENDAALFFIRPVVYSSATDADCRDSSYQQLVLDVPNAVSPGVVAWSASQCSPANGTSALNVVALPPTPPPNPPLPPPPSKVQASSQPHPAIPPLPVSAWVVNAPPNIAAPPPRPPRQTPSPTSLPGLNSSSSPTLIQLPPGGGVGDGVVGMGTPPPPLGADSNSGGGFLQSAGGVAVVASAGAAVLAAAFVVVVVVVYCRRSHRDQPGDFENKPGVEAAPAASKKGMYPAPAGHAATASITIVTNSQAYDDRAGSGQAGDGDDHLHVGRQQLQLASLSSALVCQTAVGLDGAPASPRDDEVRGIRAMLLLLLYQPTK